MQRLCCLLTTSWWTSTKTLPMPLRGWFLHLPRMLWWQQREPCNCLRRMKECQMATSYTWPKFGTFAHSSAWLLCYHEPGILCVVFAHASGMRFGKTFRFGILLLTWDATSLLCFSSFDFSSSVCFSSSISTLHIVGSLTIETSFECSCLATKAISSPDSERARTSWWLGGCHCRTSV